jgi:hypothetical protein
MVEASGRSADVNVVEGRGVEAERGEGCCARGGDFLAPEDEDEGRLGGNSS